MTSNVRLSAAKIRFTKSKLRMLHTLCRASDLRAREKRRKVKVTFIGFIKRENCLHKIKPIKRPVDHTGGP